MAAAARQPDDRTHDLEAALGHRFARAALLAEALTHRSALQRKGRVAARSLSNERLEFLGDRVLNLLTAEWLLELHPHEPEGALGHRLAALVSRDTLARVADRIGLTGALTFGEGEARAGVGRVANVRADALEAVLGAVFQDSGIDAARRVVRRLWRQDVESQAQPPKDPKTALQEWLLARALPLPAYTLAASSGPSHDPLFTVTVAAKGETGQGAARSKQDAQRLAAEDLLGKLVRT